MADGLSTEATRLLVVLREEERCALEAARPVRHMTDAELAGRTSLHVRKIIDAAKELLRSGVLVLADGRGRWIGTLPEAVRYADRLEKRGRAVFGRVQALRAGIAMHQQQLELPYGVPA